MLIWLIVINFRSIWLCIVIEFFFLLSCTDHFIRMWIFLLVLSNLWCSIFLVSGVLSINLSDGLWKVMWCHDFWCSIAILGRLGEDWQIVSDHIVSPHISSNFRQFHWQATCLFWLFNFAIELEWYWFLQ